MSLHMTTLIEVRHLKLEFNKWISDCNKKVLLHDHKRHTARAVAVACCDSRGRGYPIWSW